MTLVQEYLKNHSTNQLYDEHGVALRVSLTRPYKVSLNYNQLVVKDDDPLAQQCRGLVIMKEDGTDIDHISPLGETRVLARPFDRFFNLGQGEAADVDLAHAETSIFEKLDGSLTIVYYDLVSSDWCVATRSVPDADLIISNWPEDNMTFRTLFEEAVTRQLNRDFSSLTGAMDPTRTYMFELCTPVNQIVVTHNDFSITLIGCRETATGREFWPHDVAPEIDVPAVARHSFGSVDQMMEVVSSRNPREHEGVVACDSNFRRVKIKSAQYVSMSRLKDKVSSPRNVMTLILKGNLDDAIPVMSIAILANALRIKEGFRVLCKNYRPQYEKALEEAAICQAETGWNKRKAFAISARKNVRMFHAAMMEYGGRGEGGVLGYIGHQKPGPDGSLPDAFLDSIIKESLAELEEEENAKAAMSPTIIDRRPVE